MAQERLQEFEEPPTTAARSPDDAQRAAALTPNATAVTITQSRTLIPLEQPRALADRILAFWASL